MSKLILLTRGKSAIVDDDDYEELSKHKWWCSEKRSTKVSEPLYYAARTIGENINGSIVKKNIYMHRVILNPNPEYQVDHINGNGLDNRKCNLRPCTILQNRKNRVRPSTTTQHTSKYKGVNWHKGSCKWNAHIGVNGKAIYLGLFETEDEAAIIYNEAAIKYFGEFARLNNIDSDVKPKRTKRGKSKYKGVTWSKEKQKWHVQIYDKKLSEIEKRSCMKFIGYYKSENEGALAYNAMALLMYGEFAKLNIIDEGGLDANL